MNDKRRMNEEGKKCVCKELERRGLDPAHHGNTVFVEAGRIEVRTSRHFRWITGLTQKKLKGETAWPAFWVLASMDAVPPHTPRFFILSHKEMERVQKKRNDAYFKRYRQRHGTDYDPKNGVDNVTIEHVKDYEGRWDLIE